MAAPVMAVMDLGLEALCEAERPLPGLPIALGLGVAVLGLGAAAAPVLHWYSARWRERVHGPVEEGASVCREAYIPYIGPCESLAAAEAWLRERGEVPEGAEALKIRRGVIAGSTGVTEATRREAQRVKDREAGMRLYWESAP